MNSKVKDGFKAMNGVLPHPVLGMEAEDFREAAHKLIDVIIDYDKTMEKGEIPALPNVKPGFMRQRVETEAPMEGEKWQDVFKDIESVIFDGCLHWKSSNNLGSYPSSACYPSLLGDLLCSGLSQVGFSWFSSPACTELETVMMDWLAKALGLPEFFIHDGKGPGGGIIQGSASEGTLMTLLSARTKTIRQIQSRDPTQCFHGIAHHMVGYASKYLNTSLARTGSIALVELRMLDVDENGSLCVETLRKAIEEDLKKGKFPYYVCATLGTTSSCSYDNLDKIGDLCREYNMWLHVDAAYAGSALLCPEFRHFAKGLEKADSLVINPHKWMMISLECSALWVRDISGIENRLKMKPAVYLQHEKKNQVIDYMHWQISLGRGFRSIKLWFTLRMVGLEGLRHHIRAGVARGKFFEQLVRSDERFEVLFPVMLALVCFRLVIPNKTNEELNKLNQELNQRLLIDRTFHVTAAEVNDVYFLRVSTGVPFCSNDSLEKFWNLVREEGKTILELY